MLPVQGINVYDILRRRKLVLTKAAVDALEERFEEPSAAPRPRKEQVDEQAHSAYDVILSPVITEKATLVSEANQVIFKVAPQATKKEIKSAVERPVQGQGQGRQHARPQGQGEDLPRHRALLSDTKKAIVTLEEGHSIDVTTGL